MNAPSVRTTSGETFSGADSARLAALILRRFGGEVEAAAAAWRRLLGNGCSDADFAALASAPSGESIEIEIDVDEGTIQIGNDRIGFLEVNLSGVTTLEPVLWARAFAALLTKQGVSAAVKVLR